MAKGNGLTPKGQASDAIPKLRGTKSGNTAIRSAIERLRGSENINVDPPVSSAKVSLAVRAGAQPKAQTVVYVHAGRWASEPNKNVECKLGDLGGI